jgi:hypothetical protein
LILGVKMGPLVQGVERKIFGEVSEDYITDWLDRQLYGRLSLYIRQVLFRSGRLGAVYGLHLTDNTSVVVKVHATAELRHLEAVKTCQELLTAGGYPCPVPIAGPVEADGKVFVIETLLEAGEEEDAHDPQIRRAMAVSLAQQIQILKSAPVKPASLAPPPAWALYKNGPRPVSHDPIVDFSRTPEGYEWLDKLASRAAEVLQSHYQPDSIGHCDWVCQNLRFAEGKVVAAYDWDSLIAESEPVLVGISAGAFTEGGTTDRDAPTPDEVVSYLCEYESGRSQKFTKDEQTLAVAAATWVLAYNARWVLGVQGLGILPGKGCSLFNLQDFGEEYLNLRW